MVGLMSRAAARRASGSATRAFRIFLLMASRRLKSDRFLSKDYRAEVYTKAGDRLGREETTMIDVITRHFPVAGRADEGARQRVQAVDGEEVSANREQRWMSFWSWP